MPMFQAPRVIFPLEDIVYLELIHSKNGPTGGVEVILKGTTYDGDGDYWNNAAFVGPEDSPRLLKEWAQYKDKKEREDGREKQ